MSNLDHLVSNNLLAGKKGLIMGVANDRSIAWSIAKICSDAGAEIALSYQGEILEKRVNSLAKEIRCPIVVSCDVSNTNSISEAFEQIANKWGNLDFIVHAIAFSDKNELKGRYIDTSLDNFLLTMNISCYSFAAVAKYASQLMKDGGNMITLTYYGAEKAIPNYNVMGVAKAALESSVRYIALDLGKDNIRVNAISAGPIKTLASSGISDLRAMLSWVEKNSVLQRNITGEEVAGTALYLLSNLSSGVTGEIIHVDNGYHAVGMRLLDDCSDNKGKS